MNWLQFARLIHSIYGDGDTLPDIEWIQRLGLLAVKLGQVHALRIDFLGREKCEQLARLYRRNTATALGAEDFGALLRSSAVEDFVDAFSDVDPDPIAVASIGQVHRARLRDGQEVVVKAVKPGIREKFVADVRSLRRLFRLGTLVYPPLRHVGDPAGILEDIERLTMTELDLRNEIAGHACLADIAEVQGASFDLSRMRLPRIHRRLSNENVLVTEFIDAPSVDELLEDGALDYGLLLELFRLHGFFMFVVGTFHGDLHPGNVLVRDGNFYFIDTAYIATVGDRLRNGLFRFFEALTRYDFEISASALHRMSTRWLDRQAYRRFEARFVELYADFEGATVSEISLTTQMMQTIKLGVRSGMSFERDMFGIIRSLMYLDGMVLRCKPDAVLIRDMRGPVVELMEHAAKGPTERRLEALIRQNGNGRYPSREQQRAVSVASGLEPKFSDD